MQTNLNRAGTLLLLAKILTKITENKFLWDASLISLEIRGGHHSADVFNSNIFWADMCHAIFLLAHDWANSLHVGLCRLPPKIAGLAVMRLSSWGSGMKDRLLFGRQECLSSFNFFYFSIPTLLRIWRATDLRSVSVAALQGGDFLQFLNCVPN